MRRLLAAVLIACLPSLVRAQAPTSSTSAEREAVLATVQKFFDTMAAADVEGNRSVLAPEGRFFAWQEGKPGSPATVRASSNEEWLKQLASGKRKLRERMWNPEVRVHGSIAMVWTPYDFWIDGKFSHCGVDVFNLVRMPDGWKLSGGAYTVERTGCEPSPLGPLK